jgi:hypothetical protein
VFDDAWWEHAPSREVASMWEHAAQWQGQHPEADASATAEQASERIRREVGKRWGVDVTELVGLAELQELDRQYETAVQEREQLVGVPDNTVPTDRVAAADERVEALTAERERLAYAAGVTTAGADPARASATHKDRAAVRGGAGERFDTPGRRLQLGEQLRDAGAPGDAVEARTRADTGQAAEATQAVRQPATPGQQPRRIAGRSTGRVHRRQR